MLTRLSLRRALELIGVDPRAFWGVQPTMPDRIFWPTPREAPEGKPTRLEFQRAVEVVERLVLGSDNIWITSPTIEPAPGPQVRYAGQTTASWARRAIQLAIQGERKFIGTALLTPVNGRVLIDWVEPYYNFVETARTKPLLQELVLSCSACHDAYNSFPIICYLGGEEVGIMVDPWEVIAPSVYVDVRGPIPPTNFSWGTVDVWGYIGKALGHHGEIVPPGQCDTVLVYSGIERPEIWLRILAGYLPNVCGASNLVRFWAQITDPLTVTGWGGTVGAVEAWSMRATIRE